MEKQLSKHWRVFGHPGAKALGLLPRGGRAGAFVEQFVNFAAECAEAAGPKYARDYGILVMGMGDMKHVADVPIKALEAIVRMYNCDGDLLLSYTDRQARLYQALELPISGTRDNVVGSLVWDDDYDSFVLKFDREYVYEECVDAIVLDAQEWGAASTELFHEYGLTCDGDLSGVHDWSGAYAPVEAHNATD